MPKTKTYGPSRRYTVTTYDKLRSFVQAFAAGKYDFITLIGRGGVGKSETARRAMPSYHFISGRITPICLYEELFDHRDEDIVIDDAQNVYANDTAIDLMKAATEQRPVRTIRWRTMSLNSINKRRMDDDLEPLPSVFKTRSRIMQIGNHIWDCKDEDTGALAGRQVAILKFDPSASEIHNEAGNWFQDQEVYEYIGDHLHLAQHKLELRAYNHAVKNRDAGQDWRDMLLEEWLPDNEKLRGIYHLLDDPSFPSHTARAKAFTDRGLGSSRMFWRKLKELRNGNGSGKVRGKPR